MDVAGAFNNVHHERLIHNMKKRRIPTFILEWTHSFLNNRTTQLKFNGVTSESIPTNAGVPQGSPMSPILYMYYNGDLLDVPKQRGQSLGFIDDIVYGVQGLTDDGNAERLATLLKEAEEWRKGHGAKFERTKYLLVHFTRNNRRKTTSPIEIADVIIQPSEEARYLGVIFDKRLRFASHLQHVAKKGTKFALAISRIAKSTWGAHYRHARQLFTAVVAPRMDYAASIWHRPAKYGETHPQSQINKLVTAQRLAMRAIIGCFRTTATPALEIETALAPAHIRLQSKILRTFTRMQTLPEKHPVTAWIEQAVKRRNEQVAFVSNLEYIARTFPQYGNTLMEKILPFIRPPWWTPSILITILDNKSAAKKHHDEREQDPNTIRVYTDGSGIDGQIGAAAYCAEAGETKYQYLGKESAFNVYAAELTAIKLATEIIQTHATKYKNCVVYADSQPAIKATTRPERQSGQAIIRDVLDAIESLQKQHPHITISLTWIPGHMDIYGNETADAAAKEAARGRSGTQFKHNALKSSRNMTIKKASQTEWTTIWQNGKENSRQLRRITKKRMVQSGPKIYNSITTRAKMATIVRLRTGHCFLNQYRHRIGYEESPECTTCGNGRIENVEHFLLHCSKYEKEQMALTKEVGLGGMWMEKLLGYPRIIKHTLEYVEKTRRFEI
jgi:ribonuclease HI